MRQAVAPRTTLSLVVLVAALCMSAMACSANAQPPQRIVSLNLCVDQILIDLVEPDRIAALSFLSTDRSMSAVAARAQDFARVRGTTESILALQPDLVIAGAFSTPATRQLLKRLGTRVVEVAQPATIGGVRTLVRQLAKLVGSPERGQAVVAAFDARIAEAKALAAPNKTDAHRSPTALAIQVNNIVSPPGALLHDAMRLAGLRNLAEEMPASRRGRVALETIATSPPDILVFANSPADFTTVLSDNLRHPIYRTLAEQRPAVRLPMWATLCGTPYVAEAVMRLARARAELMKGQR